MSKEAMKLALENSQPSFMSPGWTLVRNEDITALREALAEQPAQQEPVAWLEILRNNKTATNEVIGAFLRGHAEHLTRETFVLSTPAAPQPAQRKPLTDEQINKAAEDEDNETAFLVGFYAGARFAEAAHGIKENT